MGSYTEILERESCEIYVELDDFTDNLIKVASIFRSFNEAMDVFITEHGYMENIDNVENKSTFIRDKFKKASIKVPRGIKEWFTNHKRIERDTAFQICFAFDLNIEQTNDFFRKVYFGRSFDCHTINEAIYYYCMSNNLHYNDALELIKESPKDSKCKFDENNKVLYTGTIIEQIKLFTDKNDLLSYFNTNIEQFGFNNATAAKYIKDIWNKISEIDGLAYQESCLLTDNNEEKTWKNQSIWNIYIQILGLDKEMVCNKKYDRSLKHILSDNALLHPIAEASFPDREGINSILNGKHVSYERVRKILILLLFYKYWIELAIKNNAPLLSAKNGDAERCIANINNYLLSSGYSELYIGDPYDWIFLWAIEDDYPLSTFRFYMNELFAVKNEQIEEKSI